MNPFACVCGKKRDDVCLGEMALSRIENEIFIFRQSLEKAMSVTSLDERDEGATVSQRFLTTSHGALERKNFGYFKKFKAINLNPRGHRINENWSLCELNQEEV